MVGPSCQNDSSSLTNSHHSGRNVFHLLARREVSPRTKHVPKRQWSEASKSNANSSCRPSPNNDAATDAKHGLISWVEAESLRHLSAKYCPLVPPPRSTIAAAFSPDGRSLASTHGDHTVKIIDCRSGSCLKVLSGHRRTPWVVRFHPVRPEILASGSLDHEVRLWDANTSECIGSRDFCRPIASIAFHAEGELLAVASGHKLYIWHYNKRGEASSPTIVLRTRRSLRAVHFHPHAAPFLLTAEVNDLDSSDTSMTRATSPGYLQYPPPSVFVANDMQYASGDAGSRGMQVDSSNAVQVEANAAELYNNMVSPMDASPVIPSVAHPSIEDSTNNYLPNVMGNVIYDPTIDAMETSEFLTVGESEPGSSVHLGNVGGTNVLPHGVPEQAPTNLDSTDFGQHQYVPRRDPPTGWELPFLQGWLIGQSQAGIPSVIPLSGGNREQSAPYVGPPSMTRNISTQNVEASAPTATIPSSTNLSGVSGRSGLRHRVPHSRTPASEFGIGTVPVNSTSRDGNDTQPIISRIQSELATSVAAAAAELPCTVKLRVWSHDINAPCAPLNADRCRLTIPHAVLCSEMGAHFSPCGRFLAACVACMLPHMEVDPGVQTVVHQDTGAATSPTRHPVSAHQVMYELRIYSLEEATFGSVLVSRAIRAAHCLTSIQFSPTSEHILLAYGRRHGSLLKSIVIDGELTLPIYTVLEVYRVSDMELVRVLPSAEDEVNVACFHPLAGGGLVYGTKEGKLRLLQYDGLHGESCTGPNFFPEENFTEVQAYALEC